MVDSLPRLVMSGYDYSTVELPRDEPGFCMLEWDIALGSDQREVFAAHALEQPGRVLVAPYPIFPVGRSAVLVHKAASDESRMAHRVPVPEGQGWAHSFGFGCIYLPQCVLERWRAERRPPMTDTRFSDWHIARYGRVTVDWAVRPQHLHGD